MKVTEFCFMMLILLVTVVLVIPLIIGSPDISGKMYASVNLTVLAAPAPPGVGAGGAGGGGRGLREVKPVTIPERIIELAEVVTEPLKQVGILTGKAVKAVGPVVKIYWPILVAISMIVTFMVVQIRRKYYHSEEE